MRVLLIALLAAISYAQTGWLPGWLSHFFPHPHLPHLFPHLRPIHPKTVLCTDDMRQHCDDGEVFLSKEWFQENLPHQGYAGEGLCAPCKSNREVEVIAADQAPHQLISKGNWLKKPYTNDYDPFYGILWAKDDGGQLYNLGACRDQSSWKKHKKCDIVALQMGLTPFEKKSFTFFGMRKPAETLVLTKKNSTYFHGSHRYLTVPDFDKDPNTYHMKSEGTPCFKDDEGLLECGFEGTYKKLYDADGKPVKANVDEYMEHTKGKLYYYPLEQDLPPLSNMTNSKIFKFVCTILIASIGYAIYEFYQKKKKEKKVVAGGASASKDELNSCGSGPWIYFGFLIFLLAFMISDLYPICAESFPPTCCPFKNVYGSSMFGILPYLLLYIPPPIFMGVAWSHGVKYGCCNCKKATENQKESLELMTHGQLHSTRWIWNPMSMVIVIAHIGMVAMRVFSGYLIGTPYKTVICTIAQCWTLLWLQGTIGKWKSPYTKTFKNFGYFVVGVMATRILIFTSTSNPGAVYFGLNSSCMEFQFPATAGLVIFLLAVAYLLISTYIANPLVKCGACGWFCMIPLTIALAIGVLINSTMSAVHSELNFCIDIHCTTDDRISVNDIGLSGSLSFALINMQSRKNHAKGTPSPEIILPPRHEGSKIKFPVRQTTTGMYASPQDEDAPDGDAGHYAFTTLFKVLNGMDFTDNDQDFSKAQKQAWFNKYDTAGLIPGWNYNLTTSDEDMGQWAFAGLAAHRLEQVEEDDAKRLPEEMRTALFKVDLSVMEDIEVRENYVPLGGCAYFTKDAEILGIIYKSVVYLPGDSDWEWAKFHWRSSVFMIVTGLDHLVGGHMLISGRTTLATEEILNKTHPLRIFLKPHTHFSQNVNWNAVFALFPANGLLHRASPFTGKGLDDLVNLSSEWVKQHSFYDATTDKNKIKNYAKLTDKYSYGEDMLDYVEIVKEYCTTFVNTYYESDDALKNDWQMEVWWHRSNMLSFRPFYDINKVRLIEHLTYYLFVVTGFHQHVGFLNQILKHTDVATWRVRKNNLGASIQGHMQIMTIALATGDPQVKLLSYDPNRLLPYDDIHRHTMQNAWKHFTGRMDELQKKITKKNQSKDRKFPCQSFLPNEQGISIGI